MCTSLDIYFNVNKWNHGLRFCVRVCSLAGAATTFFAGFSFSSTKTTSSYKTPSFDKSSLFSTWHWSYCQYVNLISSFFRKIWSWNLTPWCSNNHHQENHRHWNPPRVFTCLTCFQSFPTLPSTMWTHPNLALVIIFCFYLPFQTVFMDISKFYKLI